MIAIFSIIALGFFLGMRHATDPDHVIAVMTIVTRERKLSKSALVGAFWGIGHTLTIFIVGAVIILFNFVIPPRLGLAMELAVAIMLALLGFANLRTFFRGGDVSTPYSDSGYSERHYSQIHSHPHSHGDYIHRHAHGHQPEAHPHPADQTPLARIDRLFAGSAAYRPLRPLAIGIVHGLAGSAAVALLVLATIHSSRWAVLYLLVFGVGTIAGMMLITLSIASGLRLVNAGGNLARKLALASGLVSLGFGMVIVYQTCVVSGLLSAHPHWVPR
jgi:ABC-type nickel/cobalt efflux system permease component RcnA